MLLSQALDTVHKFSPLEFAALADLLSPELIDECLADTGVVTLRKRRLSMEQHACCAMLVSACSAKNGLPYRLTMCHPF
ncbi:transposase domain-containing protein [Scandinavium manionii]|uniref:transposase domain-containing protein n=1 Tax=Scandinavium manionii TaxID=2926520 RepID=UPI0021651824|nr:transposase domain-containing protein [Scandinavium manionii]